MHREHAAVETAGVRTAKAMGLRNLPSKTWQVKANWVIAANIAADLAAWTRLLGCYDDELGKPGRTRYRIWHIPARLAAHARQRVLKISPDWPLEGHVPRLLGSGSAPCQHQPDQHEPSRQRERRTSPARSEPVRTRASRPQGETDMRLKNARQHNQ